MPFTSPSIVHIRAVPTACICRCLCMCSRCGRRSDALMYSPHATGTGTGTGGASHDLCALQQNQTLLAPALGHGRALCASTHALRVHMPSAQAIDSRNATWLARIASPRQLLLSDQQCDRDAVRHLCGSADRPGVAANAVEGGRIAPNCLPPACGVAQQDYAGEAAISDST